MAFCIRCGLPLPADANFCARCGRGRYDVRIQREGPTPTIEGSDGSASEPLRRLKDVMRQAEAAYIRLVLSSVGGHRANAADILGISRKNLWEKMTEYGVSDTAPVPADESPTCISPAPPSTASPSATWALESPQSQTASPAGNVVDVNELFKRSGKTPESVAQESGLHIRAIERVLAGQPETSCSRRTVAKALNVSEAELRAAIRKRELR